MGSNRGRALVRGTIAATMIASACTSEDSGFRTSGARTLDSSCAEPSACQTVGTVTRVQGITADAVAYRVVGTGRLVVPMTAGSLLGDVDSYSVSALVSGRGPLSIRHVVALDPPSASPNHTATEDYDWKTASTVDGGKLLIIEGTDPTTDATIADVRAEGHSDIHCSTAAPGRRSRRASTLRDAWVSVRALVGLLP